MASSASQHSSTPGLLSCGTQFGCILTEMLPGSALVQLAVCSSKANSAVEYWCELSLPDAVRQQEMQLAAIASHPLGMALADFSVYRGYLHALVRLPLGECMLPSCTWRQRLAQARDPRPRRDAAQQAQAAEQPPIKPVPIRPVHRLINFDPPRSVARLPAAERAILQDGQGEAARMQAPTLVVPEMEMEQPSNKVPRAVPERPAPAAAAVRSSLDWGYAGTPPVKGWVNAFSVRGGTANDFIREVGDAPNTFLAVCVAGSNIDSSQYVRWNSGEYPLDPAGMQGEPRRGIQHGADMPYALTFRTWKFAADKLAEIEAQAGAAAAAE